MENIRLLQRLQTQESSINVLELEMAHRQNKRHQQRISFYDDVKKRCGPWRQRATRDAVWLWMAPSVVAAASHHVPRAAYRVGCLQAACKADAHPSGRATLHCSGAPDIDGRPRSGGVRGERGRCGAAIGRRRRMVSGGQTLGAAPPRAAYQHMGTGRRAESHKPRAASAAHNARSRPMDSQPADTHGCWPRSETPAPNKGQVVFVCGFFP